MLDNREADERFGQMEIEAEAAEQARVDRVRVHGYLIVLAREIGMAKANVEAALERQARARKDLEAAHARLLAGLSYGEEVAAIIGRDDPVEYARLALLLETAFG